MTLKLPTYLRKLRPVRLPPDLQALVDGRRPEGEWTFYETAAGVVQVRTEWRGIIESFGIDPDEFERYALRERWHTLPFPDVVEQIYKKLNISLNVRFVKKWKTALFDERIIWQVIVRDDYGIQELAESGFSPNVILDVGGHIGTFTMIASTLWPQAKIITIEPDLRPSGTRAQLLSINTADRPKVSVEKSALIGLLEDHSQDENVKKELEKDSRNHGLELSLRGDEEYSENIQKHPHLRGISVKQLLEKYDLDHIDLLKLDCEGAEANILRELDDLNVLSSIPEIRGEWHGDLAQREVESLLSESHRVKICVQKHGTFNLFRCSKK